MPETPPVKSIFLVSACLLGFCTRYDGKIKVNNTCLQFLQDCTIIPFCPEQLGGLPTPRTAADILHGDGYDVLQGTACIHTKDGDDVTSAFLSGAKQVLQLAQMQPIDGICLKARSPSCAVSGTIGVTAALLAENGYKLHEF
jgi:uncharacterized protein YbbK (DUF523 family)